MNDGPWNGGPWNGGSGGQANGGQWDGDQKNIDLLKGRRRDDRLRPVMSLMADVLPQKSAE